MSPIRIFLICAIEIQTHSYTPEAKLSPFSREAVCISITRPEIPFGTLKEVSSGSGDLILNIALNNLLSGNSSSSTIGVILPTKISPALTNVPFFIIPFVSKLTIDSASIFGIDVVISSTLALSSTSCNSYFSI